MAERRMFAKSVIDSDEFLDMPATTQNLYFHLCMRADDDGFIGNSKSIMRTVGAKDDDLKVLISKQFILPFETGIIVIKHWRVHNYIQKDRYIPTKYSGEKSKTTTISGNLYTLETECIQGVSKVDTQVRLELGKSKDSIELEREKGGVGENEPEAAVAVPRTQFAIPTLDEIKDECTAKGYPDYSLAFFAYYDSKGWVVGKTKMKKWKSALAGWHNRQIEFESKAHGGKHIPEPAISIEAQSYADELRKEGY